MRVCCASSERWRRTLIFAALWTLLGLFLGSKLIIEHRLYGQPYPWFKAHQAPTSYDSDLLAEKVQN